MPEPNQHEHWLTDELLLRRWLEFKENYIELGYRVASYEYFSQWLRNSVVGEKVQLEADVVRRRLHAYRNRSRKPQRRDRTD